MTGSHGGHGPRWHEGYQLGLRDALTGGLTFICCDEQAEMAKGYRVGREAGLQQREAAPEVGS
jgi:hypothetical protein